MISCQLFVQVTEWQTQTGVPHNHALGFVNLSVDLAHILRRLSTCDGTLTDDDVAPFVQIAADSVTVSLSAEELLNSFPSLGHHLATEVASMAAKYQVHQLCGSHCEQVAAEMETCRFFFPQLPSFCHIIARCPPLASDEEKGALEQRESFHAAVKAELRRQKVAGTLDGDDSPHRLAELLLAATNPPVRIDADKILWHGIIYERDSQVDQLYAECSALEPPPSAWHALVLALYHQSLLSRRNAKHLPKRMLSEVYVEEYNPWVLKANGGNVSVKLILHTVGKLYQYVTKASDATTGMKVASAELIKKGGQANLECSEALEDLIRDNYREVTLGQALYQLDPTLRLSRSDLKVVWLSAHVPYKRGSTSAPWYRRYAERYNMNIPMITK